MSGLNDTKIRLQECGLTSSGLKTADVAVKSTAGKVFWISMSCESASVIQINDSTDDGGTDVWHYRIPDGGHAHVNFDPPLECATGIYLDIPTGEPNVVVGYI